VDLKRRQKRRSVRGGSRVLKTLKIELHVQFTKLMKIMNFNTVEVQSTKYSVDADADNSRSRVSIRIEFNILDIAFEYGVICGTA